MQLRISPGSGKIQLFAKPATGAAVIAHGHNRRQVGDGGQRSGRNFFARGDYVVLQAVQQRGKSGASAHGDNFDGPRVGGDGITRHRSLDDRALVMPFVRFVGAVGAGIRIEQLGESGIVRQVFEVGIVARLVTVGRIQPDGLIQVADSLGEAAGQAVQRGNAVPDEVELGRISW